MSAEAPGQEGAPATALVVLTGDPDPRAVALTDDLAALLPSVTLVRTAPDAVPAPDLLVLRAGHGRPRWQQLPLRVVERVLPPAPGARIAVRLDPRFGDALRGVDLVVVLGPGEEEVAAAARAASAEPRVVSGLGPARALGAALALPHLPTGRPRRRSSLPDDELDTLRTVLRLLPGDAPVTDEVRDRARLLPWTTLDPLQRDLLVQDLLPLLGEDDVVLRGWSLLAETAPPSDEGTATTDADAGARTSSDAHADTVTRAAEDLLAAADTVLTADPATASRWVALALRLLAAVGRPVREPLRASRTGRTLTDPLDGTQDRVDGAMVAGAGTPAAVDGAGAAEPGPAPAGPASDDRGHHRVLLLPAQGSGPPLRSTLRVSPVVDVTLLGGPDVVPSSLRGAGVPDAVVEARLGAGLGLPVRAYAPFSAALQDADPDVVLVDGADQRAVLASLAAPADARVVVLLRAGDLDGPWVPLLAPGQTLVVLVPDEASHRMVRALAPEAHVAVVPGLDALRTPTAAQDDATAAAAATLRQVVLGDVGRLADLTAAGAHEEAMALVHELLDRPAGTVAPAVLQQAALTTTKAGEPRTRLAVLRRWTEADGRPLVATLVREQEGRLREFEPGWWPGDLAPTPVLPVPGRVLHVLKASLPHRTSGYAVRSFYLLRERRRAGEDVLAVTPLGFPDEPAPPVEDVGGVPHLRLARPDAPEREAPDERLDAFARRLLDVVVEHRPAVLHAHSGHRGYELALAALAVGRATGIPVVYEVRGLFEAVWTADVDRATRSELYRLRREAETRVLAEADAVVTLSDSMREDIVQRPPTPDGLAPDPATVMVVPNGVDAAAIAPREPRADLRARLGLGDGLVVGYVSNLDHPREGQETLVEAVAVLRRRGLAVSGLVVGGGERQETLERLAVERGVAEHVVLTGQVPHDDVGDYYALLDVFVVPRIDERAARLVTPLKPYEAMSMGLPVVVSALPALLEIVGEGERGATFPPGDAEALADVLEGLLADPGRRSSMARAARTWVREQRTWEAIATRYDRVYEIALAGREVRSAGGVGEPTHGVDEGA